MRVLFCAYDGPSHVNGPNIWLRRMLPLLRARGIDAQALLLLSAPPGACATLQALQSSGVPCRFALLQPNTAQRTRWLLDMIQREPPDVFVPNTVLPAYFAARYVRSAGIPTLGILHSDDAFHHALIERFVVGTEADQLSALVCVSAALAGMVEQRQRDHRPHVATRVIQLFYGVPIPTTCTQPPGERFRLIYVGRMDEQQKRVSDVARAMCAAAQALPGVEGELYGHGHARPAIEAILAEQGARLPVQLNNQQPPERIATALAHAHALVLLSRYEGLPIALMEAMAYGVVPICSPMRSGIGELVRHNENGLIVNDAGASFVAEVRRLREEPGLWARLGNAARDTIIKGYGEAAAADRWAELLGELAPTGQKTIMVQQLVLPPSHRAWAREDHRGPPLLAAVLRRGRYMLGELRRRMRSNKQ